MLELLIDSLKLSKFQDIKLAYNAMWWRNTLRRYVIYIMCVCAYVTAFCGGGYVIIIWLLRNARYGGKSTARMGYMQGRGDFFVGGRG